MCVLEDKQVFKYRALERAHEAIERTHAESIGWQSDLFIPYGITH
jgi:hypothetical protein